MMPDETKVIPDGLRIAKANTPELSKAGFQRDGINPHRPLHSTPSTTAISRPSARPTISSGPRPQARPSSRSHPGRPSSTGSRPTAISSSSAASYRCLWRQDRPVGAGAGHVSGGCGVHHSHLMAGRETSSVETPPIGQLASGQLHHHPHREEYPRAVPGGKRAGRGAGLPLAFCTPDGADTTR